MESIYTIQRQNADGKMETMIDNKTGLPILFNETMAGLTLENLRKDSPDTKVYMVKAGIEDSLSLKSGFGISVIELAQKMMEFTNNFGTQTISTGGKDIMMKAEFNAVHRTVGFRLGIDVSTFQNMINEYRRMRETNMAQTDMKTTVLENPQFDSGFWMEAFLDAECAFKQQFAKSCGMEFSQVYELMDKYFNYDKSFMFTEPVDLFMRAIVPRGYMEFVAASQLDKAGMIDFDPSRCDKGLRKAVNERMALTRIRDGKVPIHIWAESADSVHGLMWAVSSVMDRNDERAISVFNGAVQFPCNLIDPENITVAHNLYFDKGDDWYCDSRIDISPVVKCALKMQPEDFEEYHELWRQERFGMGHSNPNIGREER